MVLGVKCWCPCLNASAGTAFKTLREGSVQTGTAYSFQNGADVNAKDMLKMTALHWATEHDHRDVVELLIKYGADVHAFSKFDKSAFDIALDKNNPETLVMLQVGWGRRSLLVVLWPTAVSALEWEGSCCACWGRFLFAERTRNMEVDEGCVISRSTSVCLLGLSGWWGFIAMHLAWL